jgi:Dyp-type peroxidase family
LTGLDFDDIQGNILAGFNKDHQSFLFVGLPPERERAQAWLDALVPDVATHTQVASFNVRYKYAKDRSTLSSLWLNVAFTADGLAKFGFPELASDPSTAFAQGLARRADIVGHVGTNAPDNWIPYFCDPSPIDAVLILAGDIESEVRVASLRYAADIVAAGGSVVAKVDGDARADAPGHDHFGFKDGVSQPGIRGVTSPHLDDPREGMPGQYLIAPGEFVLGLPRERRDPADSADQRPIPDWARSGSFLVFERLVQDVEHFRAEVARVAVESGTSEELVGAKLIGRHASGCPLELIRGLGDLGQTQRDVGATNPVVLDPAHVNDFEYLPHDAAGTYVPEAAHIRAAYPRGDGTKCAHSTRARRMLRRGIAFGSSFETHARPGSPGHASSERGLLFVSYQASLEEQFEYVQRALSDRGHAPAGNGCDAGLSHPSLFSFVNMTGGAYFFAPSPRALQRFAGR